MILDKGIVIDAYVRVSLIGIEILTIDARIVIASVDTYLRFAEAAGRLNLEQADQSEGLPELMESITSGGAKSKTKGAIEGVKDKITGDDDDDDDDKGSGDGRQRRRSTSRASSSSGLVARALNAVARGLGQQQEVSSPVYVYGVLAAADAASLTTTA